jgi:hypothetical protein
VIEHLAQSGIRGGENAQIFNEARAALKLIVEDSGKHSLFEEVMRVVDVLARYFEPYSGLARWVFHGTEIDIATDPDTAEFYATSKRDAEILAKKYKEFTNDPTYTLIYEVNPKPRLGRQFVTSM